VVYYTPWRTYRRRVYPHPIRVAPPGRNIVRHDNPVRVTPRHGDEFTGTRRIRTEPSAPRERVRVPPTRSTPDRSPEQTSPTRVAPQPAPPRERTRPREQTSVAPERRQSPTVRDAPAPAPSRVRAAPPARPQIQSGALSHQATRISPQGGMSSRTRVIGSSRGR
jgi:hypothetical protein